MLGLFMVPSQSIKPRFGSIVHVPAHVREGKCFTVEYIVLESNKYATIHAHMQNRARTHVTHFHYYTYIVYI